MSNPNFSPPMPGSIVRIYTSRDRKSYWEGATTDIIEASGSEPAQVRVWHSKRIVRGKEVEFAEEETKRWYRAEAAEVIEAARIDSEDDEPDA